MFKTKLTLLLILALSLTLIACNGSEEEYVPAEPQGEIVTEEVEVEIEPEPAEIPSLDEPHPITLIEAVEIVESRGFDIENLFLNIGFEEGGELSNHAPLRGPDLVNITSHEAANDRFPQMNFIWESSSGKRVSLELTGGQLSAVWGTNENNNNISVLVLEDSFHVSYWSIHDSFELIDVSLYEDNEFVRATVIDRITPEALEELLSE